MYFYFVMSAIQLSHQCIFISYIFYIIEKIFNALTWTNCWGKPSVTNRKWHGIYHSLLHTHTLMGVEFLKGEMFKAEKNTILCATVNNTEPVERLLNPLVLFNTSLEFIGILHKHYETSIMCIRLARHYNVFWCENGILVQINVKHVTLAFRPTFTWSSIHGLDLFSRLKVPETDVCIQGAGGSDGTIVTDVHWHYSQLVALQSPLELQLLIWPAGTVRGRE